MLSQIRAAFVSLAALSVVTGLAYPLAVTGVAQAAFPREAGGSLVARSAGPIGSRLIGQAFDDPRYFWGRPSATTDADGKPLPYNAQSSSASNLGPTNPALIDAVSARIAALKAADPDENRPIPVDLVTASGSGLDPDITPAAAEYQVHRVARARRMPVDQVRALVAAHVDERDLGVLGERRVNVLALNVALDALAANASLPSMRLPHVSEGEVR
jgi:K+-transporting ATPase ATPase C chain